MPRLVREKERRAITGVPTSTAYALIAKGLYPTPVRIGERSVAWVEDELLAWNEQRIAEGRRRA
jgi:prophage regulatory protein